MNGFGLAPSVANRRSKEITGVGLSVDCDDLRSRNDFCLVGRTIPANIYDIGVATDDQANGVPGVDAAIVRAGEVRHVLTGQGRFSRIRLVSVDQFVAAPLNAGK